MKQVLSLAPFVLALPLVIAAAIWQGNQSERWGTFPEMRPFAARLQNMPLVVGAWKGKKMGDLAEDVRQYAGAEGDIHVEYTNTRTGDTVSVFVVCGRFLDMWNHRPDRCYPAGGYELEGEMARETVRFESGKEKAEFETATFVKKDDKSKGTQIYWTWSSDGSWHATDGLEDFRKHFSRTRPVFKAYFQTSLIAKNASTEKGPCIELIKEMLPVMNQFMFTDEPTKSDNPATVTATAKPADVVKPVAAEKKKVESK